MTKRLVMIVASILLGSIIVAACTGPTEEPGTLEIEVETEEVAPPEEVPTEEPEGEDAALDGEALVQEYCATCHPLSHVSAATHDRAGWETTMDQHVADGLELGDAEREAIIEYLVSQ